MTNTFIMELLHNDAINKIKEESVCYIITDGNFVEVVNTKDEVAKYYQTFQQDFIKSNNHANHVQIYQAYPMRQEDFPKNISASVSSDIAIKLEKLAEESGKSISDILNEALKNL